MEKHRRQSHAKLGEEVELPDEFDNQGQGLHRTRANWWEKGKAYRDIRHKWNYRGGVYRGWKSFCRLLERGCFRKDEPVPATVHTRPKDSLLVHAVELQQGKSPGVRKVPETNNECVIQHQGTRSTVVAPCNKFRAGEKNRVGICSVDARKSDR